MKQNTKHVCRASKSCTCSITADEPDENCPQHCGGPDGPPRCEHCGRFIPINQKEMKNNIHIADVGSIGPDHVIVSDLMVDFKALFDESHDVHARMALIKMMKEYYIHKQDFELAVKFRESEVALRNTLEHAAKTLGKDMFKKVVETPAPTPSAPDRLAERISLVFEPVEGWYQNDKNNRSIEEMLEDAISDLQKDRTEAIKLRQLIQIMDSCIHSGYDWNADLNGITFLVGDVLNYEPQHGP